MAFIATAPLVSSTKILWQNDHSPTSQKTMRTSITKEITKGVYHWRGKAFRHLVTLFAIAYGRSEIDAPDYPASANLDCVHRFWNFWAPFHLGLEAIGTCSAANAPAVKHFGAVPIDYRAGDFVAAVGGRSMRGDSVAGSCMLPVSRR